MRLIALCISGVGNNAGGARRCDLLLPCQSPRSSQCVISTSLYNTETPIRAPCSQNAIVRHAHASPRTRGRADRAFFRDVRLGDGDGLVQLLAGSRGEGVLLGLGG